METSLMVDDYPTPPEDNSKCFIFECLCKVEVKVYADDLETAKEWCNLTDCDEYEVISIGVDDIVDYEVEK